MPLRYPPEKAFGCALSLSVTLRVPPVSLRLGHGSAHTGTPKTYFVRFGEPFFQSTGLSFTPSPPLRYPGGEA